MKKTIMLAIFAIAFAFSTELYAQNPEIKKDVVIKKELKHEMRHARKDLRRARRDIRIDRRHLREARFEMMKARHDIRRYRHHHHNT